MRMIPIVKMILTVGYLEVKILDGSGTLTACATKWTA
jgi:hypothetical protein